MKFYTDLNLLDFNSISKNIYDLQTAFLYVCLLPRTLKYKFLSTVNEEARKAFSSILLVEDEFVSSEEDCDYVLFPPCNHYVGFDDYMNQYKKQFDLISKKIILTYFTSDDSLIHVSDGIILFRGGSYRSENNFNVYGSPYIVADYYRGVLANTDITISFCGYADNHPFRKEIVDYFSKYDCFDGLLRTQWGGDSVYDRTEKDSSKIGPSMDSKMEFITNIENNLYGLFVRGTSNAAARLMEIFMMGRIPIIIDTDIMLPFENYIPYNKNTIRITNFNNIMEQVDEYHNSHTQDELVQIQLENRKIWEQYFKVDNCFHMMKKTFEHHLPI